MLNVIEINIIFEIKMIKNSRSSVSVLFGFITRINIKVLICPIAFYHNLDVNEPLDIHSLMVKFVGRGYREKQNILNVLTSESIMKKNLIHRTLFVH